MKNALVTGANRGIGLELCRQLVARGVHVIAACRTATPALRDLGGGVEIAEGVDVTDGAALAALAARVPALDLLICNAGILSAERLDALDFEAVRRQLEVNALGPLRTVHAFQGKLAPVAKVALITSRMGSIGDNGSGGYYGYRMSKAALNAAGVSLARDLRPRGVAVAILHPGFVRTEMTGNNGDTTAADAARGLLARIDGLTIQTSGAFWHANGQILPW
jgi:NAD(P)-dependent dehydrogenase (short-subunit alcohol dehydrogenase family)